MACRGIATTPHLSFAPDDASHPLQVQTMEGLLDPKHAELLVRRVRSQVAKRLTLAMDSHRAYHLRVIQLQGCVLAALALVYIATKRPGLPLSCFQNRHLYM